MLAIGLIELSKQTINHIAELVKSRFRFFGIGITCWVRKEVRGALLDALLLAAAGAVFKVYARAEVRKRQRIKAFVKFISLKDNY